MASSIATMFYACDYATKPNMVCAPLLVALRDGLLRFKERHGTRLCDSRRAAQPGIGHEKHTDARKRIERVTLDARGSVHHPVHALPFTASARRCETSRSALAAGVRGERVVALELFRDRIGEAFEITFIGSVGHIAEHRSRRRRLPAAAL